MTDLRPLLTLALIGGPVLWGILAYLAVFFVVGLYGLFADVLAILQGA